MRSTLGAVFSLMVVVELAVAQDAVIDRQSMIERRPYERRIADVASIMPTVAGQIPRSTPAPTTFLREPSPQKLPNLHPAHTSSPHRNDFAGLIMPKLTGPMLPKLTSPPNGIREQLNQLAPPPITIPGFGSAFSSLISPIVEPIQSFASQLQHLDPHRGNNPKGNLPNNGAQNGPPPHGKGGPLNNNPFAQSHVKCSAQEVSCSFLKEAAYQMQNDDDHCLKIATSFDQEGKIKFDPIVQDSDNVIYGITTDGLTASAWCNDIGWALRKIYVSCRRGKQCYGGDSYAARNSAFMVTVGPRDKGPRINIKIRRIKPAAFRILDLSNMDEPD